jgi:ubiquitin carboxyl-terminal hydrolase 5/13
MDSGRLSYRRQAARLLPLDIPLEAAVNQGEVAQFKERQAKRQRLKVRGGSGEGGGGGLLSHI